MARNCTQCGAELRDGIAFCTECGAKAPEVIQSVPVAETCANCGAPMKEGIAFCTSCGAKKGEKAAPPAPQPPKQAAPPPPPPPQQPPVAAAPVYQAPPPQQPVQQSVQAAPQQTFEQSVKGTKYEPITTGGFIGIMLLLCIPIIGFILLIVWACGGCRKISKRSFARASLILTAIVLVLSLIAGLVLKTVFDSALSSFGLNTSQLGGLLSGFGGDQENAGSSGILDLLGGLGGEANSGTGNLGSILGGLGGSANGQDTNLEDILGALGGSGTGDNAGLEDILGALGGMGNISGNTGNEEINADGWPKSLRKYPGGTATEVESYRTEITGTTLDEMKAYIEDLKKDGYKYQDFYGFGFSEDDMLGMNGWWGTNGEIYLSLSFADGTVTVDHTYELPDYNFG